MFRWVARTTFGRAVVPEVNISAASVSRSTGPFAGQQGSTARVSASSVRTRCEPNAAYALAWLRRSTRTTVQSTARSLRCRAGTSRLVENGTAT